jgi:hypothetical protein
MTVSLFPITAMAAEEPAPMDVFVTISDENGELVLIKEPVRVTDLDEDGVLTVNDALLAAHKKHCKDGYIASDKYGDLEIIKLWGVSDRAYGVFNNGGYVWRLIEYLADGDHVQAYVYRDSENRSDAFSYFSREELTFKNGKETLTLYAYSVTEDDNLLSHPVSGATITVNGESTGIKTDKDGKFTLSASDLLMGEKNVISARSDRERIVPPVLVVTPNAENIKKTYSEGLLLALMILTVVLVTAAVFTVRLITDKKKTSTKPNATAPTTQNKPQHHHKKRKK